MSSQFYSRRDDSFAAVAAIDPYAIGWITTYLYVSILHIHPKSWPPNEFSNDDSKSFNSISVVAFVFISKSVRSDISEALNWGEDIRVFTLFEVEQRLYHRWVFVDVKA
jgi:hypothetical protein